MVNLNYSEITSMTTRMTKTRMDGTMTQIRSFACGEKRGMTKNVLASFCSLGSGHFNIELNRGRLPTCRKI